MAGVEVYMDWAEAALIKLLASGELKEEEAQRLRAILRRACRQNIHEI